jgi:all-trans-retinol dehydrogenase (NAD+)
MTAISGNTALVTGGVSGIGRLLAERLARRGAEVVVWDLDPARIDEAVAELRRATGARVHGYACDVTDRARVYQTADRVRAEVGDVGILVNNAGVVSGRPLLEIPDEKIELTFRVNALALYWVTKAFLPAMIAGDRGHVVTVASAAGLVGVARQTDYAASKHAAVGFDESLRVELAHTAPGVVTTVVCPYYVDTGMFEGVKTRVPFLLPILAQERVADRIVRAIERDRRVLCMPPLVRLLPLARMLPPRAFDKLMDLFGINASMEHFIGRGATRRRE